ncbi:MAG: DUF4276 family protein [Terracidiphilus sp.]
MKIRLYVEGGPQGVDTDGLRRFRSAFKQYFEHFDPQLKSLDVIARGATERTIKNYAEGVRRHAAEGVVALLVDSDTPVTASSPAKHLASKLDGAKVPNDARANVFLMVQCMEAWLITDVAALENCYGAKAREMKLPADPDVEAIPKKDLFAALNSLAKNTPIGRYHKIHHAARILAVLSPELVAKRSKHAQKLHEFLRRSLIA